MSKEIDTDIAHKLSDARPEDVVDVPGLGTVECVTNLSCGQCALQSMHCGTVSCSWKENDGVIRFKQFKKVGETANSLFGVELTAKEIEVLKAVMTEVHRAEELHPAWPSDKIYQAAIVAEEAGELIQAVLNTIEKHGSKSDVEKEAIHVTAMGLRFLKNFKK